MPRVTSDFDHLLSPRRPAGGRWGWCRPGPVSDSACRLSPAVVLAAWGLLVGCVGAPGGGAGEDPAGGTSWQPLPEVLSAAFQEEFEQWEAPGGAVAIFHDGTLYAQGFGSRRPDEDDPAQPTTLFRIGSITKVLTATGLLRLVDAGTMALEDPLSTHAPDVSLVGEGAVGEVTMHQLLSHQSGISEYTPIAGGGEDERLAVCSRWEFGNNAWMMVPPGSFWNYSNPNFALAGLAMEQADGRWYRQIVQEEVFDPLGLSRSHFLGPEVLADGDYAVGLGYDWTGASSDPVPSGPDSYDDAWSRPAGWAWSSVLDMVTFGRFLVDGDSAFLSNTLHEQLVSERVNTQMFMDHIGYGYGLMVSDGMQVGTSNWFELPIVSHNGALYGFSAELLTVPSENLVIAALVSGDGAYFNEAIGAAFEQLLGAEAGVIPDLGLNPEDWPNYVGTYSDPYNVGDIVISMEGDDLVISMPELDALGYPYESTLVPLTAGRFGLAIGGAHTDVSFLSEDSDGPTKWFRQRNFVGTRQDDVGRSAGEAALLPSQRRERIEQLVASIKATERRGPSL